MSQQFKIVKKIILFLARITFNTYVPYIRTYPHKTHKYDI